MFQSFRNKKRIWALLAMILVIPAFVFIGINGYSRLNPDANAIAKVDGKGIQPEEFDQAKRNHIERVRIQQGGSVDASLFDTPEANATILANLTTERALGAQMQHNYINVGENDAIAYIKQAEAFQQNGQFSPELYQNYLAARGKSDAQFVYELRADLARELLINSVTRTVFVPTKTVEMVNDILNEERAVRTLTFDPIKYLDKVKVTDEQVQKYYDEHKEDYRVPETVNIEYVVFSPDTIKKLDEPGEDVLKQFYEQNKTKYGMDETRRASHILITPEASEGADADADAKKKAEEVYEKAKADPDSFAKLAEEYSMDEGSAKNGGDLDFFSKGEMVPEFDEAVFNPNVKKGDIIGPIKTEYGYHIIKLTDIAPAHLRSFEEVEPEIHQLWMDQQKQVQFAENADNFTNMVYEQSDSLQPVAERFGLQIHTVDGLTEKGVDANSNDGTYLTKRVVSEIFQPESINEKRNIQAIEIGNNTIVSARVLKATPAHLQTLDEVKKEVEKALELSEASALAKVDGEAKLKELQEKSNLDDFSDSITVSRAKPEHQSEYLVNAEMQVPAAKLPTYIGTADKNGDYVISYIESSTLPPKDGTEFTDLKNEITVADSMGEELAYYAALKDLYKLQILKKEYDYQIPKAMK
ncbi:MAG: SurA N-terminal domain-containing protein [Burkholderiales bacterium]|nr:SurA N-terminal domain-containing protein [Burkholderiales bacterium]